MTETISYYSFSEKSPNKDLTIKALTYSDSL